MHILFNTDGKSDLVFQNGGSDTVGSKPPSSGRGDVRGLGYSQERGLPLLGSIFPVQSYGIVVLPALSTDYSCCSLQNFERKCAWAVIVAFEVSMAAYTIDRLGRS